MPFGRRVSLSRTGLKKELTVTPFTPGDYAPVNYVLYKLTNKFMYIPRYFSNEGELILNDICYEDISMNSSPREYQKKAIEDIHSELLKNGSCIACLYTGWGKTFASLYVSQLLGVKTIILVNKESLMEQWKDQIEKFLGISPGIIQGKNTNTDSCICIGMIQSISMKDYPEEIFKEFSFAVYDETHNYCSKVFSSVFYKIGAKYNLGLTATLKRADRLEYTLEWFLSKVAVNVQLLIIEPEIHIYNFSDFSENVIKYLPNGKVNSPASITSITEIESRNIYILKLIKECYASNRKILVLSDRKAHCDFLFNSLKEYSVGLYYGGMKTCDLKKSNECSIIIATYQMASEGYDNPGLDTLILASPKGNVEQAVGRILRRKNENPPLVIDINDTISVFNNWHRKRLSLYKSKKFKINYINKNIGDQDSTPDCISECISECIIRS
jgi:superfamily II DNA or RNA helicase